MLIFSFKDLTHLLLDLLLGPFLCINVSFYLTALFNWLLLYIKTQKI